MVLKSLLIGALCGAFIIVINTALLSNGLGHALLGFTVMFAVLSSIYFVQKKDPNYAKGFGPVFGQGMLMSLGATIAYVGLWELYMRSTDYAFYAARQTSRRCCRPGTGRRYCRSE